MGVADANAAALQMQACKVQRRAAGGAADTADAGSVMPPVRSEEKLGCEMQVAAASAS